ncbi:MAG: glutathione S-transferase family protein [Panacagrimonas sp.]
MLKIHHLVLSRSDRIVWLAEELGVPYELVRHIRRPENFRAPDSLWAVHPMGKAPVIEDDGQTIFESGAIVEYMIDRYGKGRLKPAAGTPEYMAYLHWMHAAESTLMVPVLMDVLLLLTQSDAPAMRGFCEGEYATVFKFLDDTLARTPFVAGSELTGADIMVAYSLQLGDGTAIPIMKGAAPTHLPNIAAYLARISARPAYRKARELCA